MKNLEKGDYLKIIACAFCNHGYACDLPEHCLIGDVCKKVGNQLPRIIEQHFSNNLIIFGDGNYGVARGAIDGNPTNELIIHRLGKPVKPIGKSLEGYIGKTADEVDTVARLFFKNSESVQIVIDNLIVIKNKIIEWEQTNGEK